MKKYSILSAALLVLAVAACSKNEKFVEEQALPIEDPARGTYIQAHGDVDTKAQINKTSGAFTWSAGDAIAVYTSAGYIQSDPLEEGGSASAKFYFSGDFEDATRADIAVFPASLVFDGTAVRANSASHHSASAPTITLPSSYTLAQARGEESPRPMIAVNTPGEALAFKSICALVRITVNNIAKDAHTLKVTFPGKKVQGEFALSDFEIGTSGVVTTDSEESGDDTITITDLGISSFISGLIINVPVPVGVAESQEYLYVRVGAYDSYGNKIHSIDTPIKTVSSAPTAWAPGRKAARKVTANLPVFTIENNVGVPANKKVVFAPGNLQAVLAAKPSSNKPGYASSWQFAEHQYTAIGDFTPEGRSYSINSLQSPQVGDVIDLFGWIGESASFYAEGDYADDKYKFGIIYPSGDQLTNITGNATGDNILLDWGHNEISDGKGGTYPADSWRTLNSNEWSRVITNRKTTASGYPIIDSFAKAQLTSGDNVVARGLILLPDEYTHPAGVPALTNVYTQGNTSTPKTVNCDVNSYSIEQWEKLEGAGCVFLPLTNVRTKASDAVTSGPADGAYWCSVSQTSNADGSVFVFKGLSSGSVLGKNFQVGASCQRKNGVAVRLVREVN